MRQIRGWINSICLTIARKEHERIVRNAVVCESNRHYDDYKRGYLAGHGKAQDEVRGTAWDSGYMRGWADGRAWDYESASAEYGAEKERERNALPVV